MPNFILKMSSNSGCQVEVATHEFEIALIDLATNIGLALSVIGFTGNVQFYIESIGGVTYFSTVTFNKDFPKGYWNTTKV